MKFLVVFALVFMYLLAIGQDKKDKAEFKEYKKGESYYYNTILKDVNAVEDKKNPVKPYTYLSVDFDKIDFPDDPSEYTTVQHGKPVSQGNTGTCWCYSATSFMEAEIKRINDIDVKLSEMWTVYWEYVERAIDFVKTRGETYFEQGSEANAIPKIWKKYGIVPYSVYSGLEEGRKFHSHKDMIKEMKDYLKSVKEQNAWNEEEVANTIKSILNHYMGKPPKNFTYEKQKFDPHRFMKGYLKINMNDYFSFMSTMEWNYNEMHELVEADNWWHGANYWNLSLDDYMKLIKETIKKGYSISICGDISDPGFSSFEEVGIVPSFDIPSEYIDENSRQYRLSNKTTTDDHCVHLVGYKIVNKKWWFLLKDSGASGHTGEHQGYCFYHEDYIKLKMMNVMIHKEAAKGILDGIIK